jgi:guanylate kinase
MNQSEDLERRLRNARAEVRLWRDFDYVIINDDLDRASHSLQAIIMGERCRPDRQESNICEILKTFEGESSNA